MLDKFLAIFYRNFIFFKTDISSNHVPDNSFNHSQMKVLENNEKVI